MVVYVKDRRKAPSFRAGIRAVRLLRPTATLKPAGVEPTVTQSPKSNGSRSGSFPPIWTAGPTYPELPKVLTVPLPLKHWDGATAQPNTAPPACESVHRGRKDRQADGTARALAPRKRREGASLHSLAGERDARGKEIAGPSGRVIRHTPRGAHVGRTHQKPSPPLADGEDTSRRVGRPDPERRNPRPSGRGGCQRSSSISSSSYSSSKSRLRSCASSARCISCSRRC